MMGPLSIGSTKDQDEFWRLLHSLGIIIKWGTEEYEEWVRKNMLAKVLSSLDSRANFYASLDRV